MELEKIVEAQQAVDMQHPLRALSISHCFPFLSLNWLKRLSSRNTGYTTQTDEPKIKVKVGKRKKRG